MTAARSNHIGQALWVRIFRDGRNLIDFARSVPRTLNLSGMTQLLARREVPRQTAAVSDYEWIQVPAKPWEMGFASRKHMLLLMLGSISVDGERVVLRRSV